eukprot:365770-Chlamydomonas_euryale.AAC.1
MCDVQEGSEKLAMRSGSGAACGGCRGPHKGVGWCEKREKRRGRGGEDIRDIRDIRGGRGRGEEGDEEREGGGRISGEQHGVEGEKHGVQGQTGGRVGGRGGDALVKWGRQVIRVFVRVALNVERYPPFTVHRSA